MHHIDAHWNIHKGKLQMDEVKIDCVQVTPEVGAHLKECSVTSKPYEDLLQDVQRLAAAKKCLWIDPAKVCISPGPSAQQLAPWAPPTPLFTRQLFVLSKFADGTSNQAEGMMPSGPVIKDLVAVAHTRLSLLHGAHEQHKQTSGIPELSLISHGRA